MKYLLVILLLPVFILMHTAAGRADDVVGPIPPGGWGTSCENYIEYSDAWSSGEIIYNPLLGAGGEGWVYCSDCSTQVDWPGLDIELWVEMECVLTWDHTHAQIHRASEYSDFYLYFHGTSACNNGQYMIVTAPDGGTLAVLDFKDDVLGWGPTRGTDIPLTWAASVDGGAYAPMVPDGNDLYFLVDPSNHYFDVRVLVDMDYHQEDGYYYLGGEGYSICPTTPL